MSVWTVSCTDHVHLRYRSHTSHLHVHLYQERRSWDNSLEPLTSFVLLTCEVWPETVVVVVQETVQQLTHVVGRLVGQQAAGYLPAILPLSGLAGKGRNIEIFHFLYYKLMTNFHSSKLIKPILTFIITSSSKQKWCSKKSAETLLNAWDIFSKSGDWAEKYFIFLAIDTGHYLCPMELMER